MPRPAAIPLPRSICRICDSITGNRFDPIKPFSNIPIPIPSMARPRTRINQAILAANTIQKRTLASAVSSSRKTKSNSRNTRDASRKPDGTPKQERSPIHGMMEHVKECIYKVTKNEGIPPEEDVNAALEACRDFADVLTDERMQKRLSQLASEQHSTSSDLLSLDRANGSSRSKPPEVALARLTAVINEVIDEVSKITLSILTHPPVFITPAILKQYVDIQARLGRPESLPLVFEMYVSRPMPRESSGSISYVRQNPNKMANAIDPKVIEMALDVAIEAKNLDAAIGVIENGYASKAFIRNKLVRRCMVPGGTFAATPMAAYIVAMNFSDLQNAMDAATATNVAFIGILAYVGFTASIGLVSVMTANDQMQRVTWAPGMALRSRWIREEERAALDKVACAWGFREKWRQGEEEGADWDALREYIGQKGMILDRTELMEGMQ